MWHDLRLGWRRLTQAPGFAALAIGTLALGIAATTTVFSLANAFLWRPLPIADPARAIRVYRHADANSSYPDCEDYRDRNQTLAGLAAYQVSTVSLRDGSASPSYVFGEIVTSNYFDVLGVRPAIGRFFLPEDGMTPGTPTVVVLGHRLWQQMFGGDRGVIGRRVRVNGVVCTVIGVAPRDYSSGLPPYRADFFVPMLLDPALRPGARA